MNSIQEKKEMLSELHGERICIRAKLTELSAVMPKIETPKIREMICRMMELLEELERLYGTACDSVLDDHELSFCECHKKSEKLWGEVHALDEQVCEMLDGGKRRKVSKPCPERALAGLEEAWRDAGATIQKMDRQLDTLSRDGFLDCEKATSYLLCVRLLEEALRREDAIAARRWLNAIQEIGILATKDAYHIPLRLRLAAWLGCIQVRFREWTRYGHASRKQKPSKGIISIRLP